MTDHELHLKSFIPRKDVFKAWPLKNFSYNESVSDIVDHLLFSLSGVKQDGPIADLCVDLGLISKKSSVTLTVIGKRVLYYGLKVRLEA